MLFSPLRSLFVVILFITLSLYICAVDGSKRPYYEKVLNFFKYVGRNYIERNVTTELIPKGNRTALLPHTLTQAVEQNNIPPIVEALDNGLDIQATDYSLSMSLLHHAARQKNFELTKLLIARGADVNAFDKDRSTPLHFAAYEPGNLAIVNFLLEHGAIPDLIDDEGLSPLDYAKFADDPEMIAAINIAIAKRKSP